KRSPCNWPLTIEHLVIQSAREQPADAEHIDSGAKSAISEAIFALAETARPMVYRNFHQPVSCSSNEGRDETVHAFKWNQRAHTFAPHCLERTTGVAHVVFRKTAANKS